MLTDEQPSAEQIELFRQMTPEQRWRVARQLYWTMRRTFRTVPQKNRPPKKYPKKRLPRGAQKCYTGRAIGKN
jgi:hypothetical protein